MIGLGIPVMEVYCGNMERRAAFGLAQMEYGLPPSHETSSSFLWAIINHWGVSHVVRDTWTKPFRRRSKPKLSPACRALCEAFLRNTEHMVA